MNKKQKLKLRVTQILVQIHRGFLTDEQSNSLTDEQVIANVPVNGVTPKALENEEHIMVNKPFTYRWVKIRVKKDPTVTAFDMLVEAGFRDAE